MKPKYSKSIMASYATFKELYNSKTYHSPYQILSEFMRYVIVSRCLYSFTATDIQGYLNDEFGFNPPLAVIRTAIKNIPDIIKNHQKYQASGIQWNETFHNYRHQSEEKSNTITNELFEYADSKGVLNFDKQKLAQEFISFVLDEDVDPSYQQIIGGFVLASEHDTTIRDAISSIREGSILYSGLSFNISEFGSLTQPITLFLDTEILFDIAGLNGELFKTLADDFLKLVNEANKRGKVISLKFFSKVADDIDQFYRKAERIVSGKYPTDFSQAMKSIVDGCKDSSDISDKKVELLRKLQIECGIQKDDKSDYYTSSDYHFNLENEKISEYPVEDEINAEGFMFCSNINKLRKGFKTRDYLSSRYLCVTDTRRVREISIAIAERQSNVKTGEKYCGYAVSLSYITNLLWYKLNRGFGSVEFPKNLDVVIKARVILSSYITQGITSTYKEIQTKFESGNLTTEQAVARIIALKEKTILPENLNTNNLENALDFSENYFSQYEETIARNRRLLLERDNTVKELSESIHNLEQQLSQAQIQNYEKQSQIDKLTDRVNAIEEQKNQKKKKQRKKKALFRLVCSIICKGLVIFTLVFVLWRICKLMKIDFPTWLGVTLSAVGLIPFFIKVFRKELQQYKNEIQ